MNRRHHLALSALGLATAALGLPLLQGCSRRESAPDVAYTLLDGQAGTLAALRGKVVLVNFWATSCTTCVHEMPQMISTFQRFQGPAFDTLAVAMSYDTPAYVSGFASSRQLPFKVALDQSGAIARAFGEVRLTPTTFVLDKRGGIVKKYVGEPDFAALHALIGELLKEA